VTGNVTADLLADTLLSIAIALLALRHFLRC
jgi:hypothetical protein